MQQVYIPMERADKLKSNKDLLEGIMQLCKCEIRITSDDIVEIKGDAYSEFIAKNIIYAFGRGFDISTASKLINNDYYFTSIDLEQRFGSEKRITQIKARVIGREGKIKKYIETVSSAKLSIYGNTISFIGTIDDVSVAEVAVNTILDGGTHRLAYTRMETAHRKIKKDQHNAKF